MARLKNTVVRRKGSSQKLKHFRNETTNTNVIIASVQRRFLNKLVSKRELWLTFDVPASGLHATTNYGIAIGTGDYAAIIKAMCDVDKDAAMSAMASELAERLKKP